jgi:hypothetical protein
MGVIGEVAATSLPGVGGRDGMGVIGEVAATSFPGVGGRDGMGVIGEVAAKQLGVTKTTAMRASRAFSRFEVIGLLLPWVNLV